MADGLSRMTNARKIGVFTMQYGPGAENAFAGVAQAFADSIPVLLLAGGSPRERYGVHPSFDCVEHYKGITKWAGYINSPERTIDVMRRAFSHLKNGRPGPVLVEIPVDVALEEAGDGFTYDPVKTSRSQADPSDVRDLVSALLKAGRPVIYAGQGVMNSEATGELIKLAECAHFPVLTTLAGKSAFPETHPLALGCGGRTTTGMVAHFLETADFALGVGTSLTKSVFSAPLPEGVTVGQITNRAEDLHKDHALAYAAVGDAKLVLLQMIEEIRRQVGDQGRNDSSDIRGEISKLRKAWLSKWEEKFTSDEIPINPYRVFREVEKVVDIPNTIVTHDSGHVRDQLVPFWRPVTPRSYIGWGKSTQLGYGLGLALGAKMACPERTVINFMGDAGFGMAGLDIETAARNQIGITTVILNNGVMTGYSKKYMPFAAKTYSSHRLGGNYAAVAQGLGAYAERIERSDRIGEALRQALLANQKGQPALLEILTKEETDISVYW